MVKEASQFQSAAHACHELVVHDAGHRYPQQCFFLGVLAPGVGDESELGQRTLEGAKDDSQADFLLDTRGSVVSPDDHLGQIAELLVLQDDLAAWIGSIACGWITPSVLGSLLLCSFPVEDATLTRLGLDQAEPLFHEDLDTWLLGVGNRVVGQSPLWVVCPPLTRLGIPHTLVAQVGQGDECRSTHTTYNYDLTDHAHDVVHFQGSQTPSSSFLEVGSGEVEQSLEWLRSTGSTTEDFQLGSSRTNLVVVHLWNVTDVQG